MLRKTKALMLPIALAIGTIAHAELSCSVSGNSWNTGYVANVTVVNSGSEMLDGWEVSLVFNDTPQVEHGWNANLVEQANTVSATHVSWNKHLYAGQSTGFGFVGAHSGSFELPTCVPAVDGNVETALEAYLKRGVEQQLTARQTSPGGGVSSSSTGSSTSSTSSSSSSSSTSASSSGVPAPSPDLQPDDITNVQESGVDEADIIESDGNHFFVVQENSIGYYPSSSTTSSTTSGTTSSTTSSSSSSSGSSGQGGAEVVISAYDKNADAGTTQFISELRLAFDKQLVTTDGAYLRSTATGNRLAVVNSTSNLNPVYWGYGYGIYPYFQISNQVEVAIADIEQPSAMQELNRIRYDGELLSSRRIDNTLYIASRYSPNLDRLGFDFSGGTEGDQNRAVLESASLSDLLPHKYHVDGSTSPLLDAKDCSLPEWPEESNIYAGSVLVIAAINLDNPSDMSAKCLPVAANDIYASTQAIYAFARGYAGGTKVHKFSLSDQMAYKGSVKVPGYIPCQPASYCFGETDNALRVLYQVYGDVNSTPYRLSVIQESLEPEEGLSIVATLPNAARPNPIGKPNERVYSMRSFGDYSYVVTFDKVDPLYAINVSNPLDPYIAGEIEVTGFSEYLHPVGENLLLGVGRDALYDPERDITWFQGVKVELFDISDPTQIKTISSDIIGKRGSRTTVNFDPRSFAFRETDNGFRFALPVQVNDRLPVAGDPALPNQYYAWSHTGLHVYEVESGALPSMYKIGVLATETYPEHLRGESIYYDRGVLEGEAVFYLHNYQFFSTLLNELMDY